MSWRDELQRVTLADGRQLVGASFRGVPFFVESAERTGGRRVLAHEFPGRDAPFVEDLGRQAPVLRVDGYVVGPAYLHERDALLAALEDVSGPGQLVHPYYGIRRAVCSGLTVRESRAAGGVATFQIEFREVPDEPVALTEAPDLAEQVDTAATAAQQTVAAELAADFSVEGQPAFALESLLVELDAARSALRTALGPLATTIEQAARLHATVHLLGLKSASLVREPVALVEALVGVVHDLVDDTVEARRELVRALLEVHDKIGGVPLALGETATRIRERANQRALVRGIRRAVVVEAARRIPFVAYETLEDALADRGRLAARIDAQASVASTAAYPSLVQLRALVQRAVPGEAVLARQLTAERRTAVPSLVLSYQLYGSTRNEADLIARNRIAHPGFVIGALTLLSDG